MKKLSILAIILSFSTQSFALSQMGQVENKPLDNDQKEIIKLFKTIKESEKNEYRFALASSFVEGMNSKNISSIKGKAIKEMVVVNFITTAKSKDSKEAKLDFVKKSDKGMVDDGFCKDTDFKFALGVGLKLKYQYKDDAGNFIYESFIDNKRCGVPLY